MPIKKGMGFWVISMVFLSHFLLSSCRTTPTKKPGGENGEGSMSMGFNKEELLKNPFFTREKDEEIFRVYLSSDFYLVQQYGSEEDIVKNDDPGGDQYIREMLKKLDRFDEEREGIVSVTLYYSSGTISKIRPVRLTFLEELDRIMVDDIQRWQFSFPQKRIKTGKFNVRYRFKLKKSEAGKQKTMEELEQEYLENNPQFQKYLMRKKLEMEKKKKEEQR